ncbi:MAG: hypothetical protein GY804_05865 [Alphaproteobacteria bacterium]|nr:hypothetical protein [Alphaproteobacteria bacterium]
MIYPSGVDTENIQNAIAMGGNGIKTVDTTGCTKEEIGMTLKAVTDRIFEDAINNNVSPFRLNDILRNHQDMDHEDIDMEPIYGPILILDSKHVR